ncbi:hypothetical protein [Nonomuraea sp. NPDC001023]|uniref:hypothetical protein n=1 Tax=unclassified Nonomuraea TaxID=2593643 RepID=UPI0033300A8A
MSDTPCWVLTNEQGTDLDQDGVPHFPTEKHAADEAAKIEGDEVFKPRQLAHLCVTAACSCCDYIYDEDEDGIAHFDSLGEAEKALAGFWEFADGKAKCDACKTGACDPEAGEHG